MKCHYEVQNTLRKVAFTDIETNMNAAIMLPQFKEGFIRKYYLLPNCTPVSMIMNPL